jgi:hypothetical protein
MDGLYSKALLPILQEALQNGDIKSILTCSQLLKMAHILLGKEGCPEPIFFIARFLNKNDRTLIFKWKKEFAPRAATIAPGSRFKTPCMLFPI